MSKPRLVVFGDSFSYGADLDPNKNPRDPRPHPDSWPFILGELLQRKTVNLAIPGFSNKGIWHLATHFRYEPTDLVILAWSNPDRSFILTKYHNKICERYARKNNSDFLVNHIKQIGSWLIEQEELSKAYYTHVYNEVDVNLQTFMYIDHAVSTIKKITPRVFNVGIPSIEIFGGMHNENTFVPPWFDVKTFLTTMDPEYKEDRTEGFHLTTSGHKSFAIRMQNLLDRHI